jgi:hypothetical protein
MSASGQRCTLAGLFAGLCVIMCGCQDAPQPVLEHAVSTLANAVQQEAPRYADNRFREAEELLKQGRLEIARQQGRLPFLRDYSVADSLLRRAASLAAQAGAEARERIDELRAQSEIEREALSGELSSWRAALDGSLPLYHGEQIWAEADLALAMTDSLIASREFQGALETAVAGRNAIIGLSRILAEYANSAAQNIDIWRTWVRETVTRSRNAGSVALIVDKSAHTLFLVQHGRLVHSYPCELGYNSAYQKFFAGDGATPEGKYKITMVKNKGSKFYKALLIDYPNERDKERFRKNKARGIISDHAKIGALIEIHGEGGRNSDWTDGCVALANADMDHLMKYVAVGTPVTIVRKSDEWP